MKRALIPLQDALETEMMYVISSGVYLMDAIPYLTSDVVC